MKKIFLMTVFIFGLLVPLTQAKEANRKFLIILQAGMESKDGLARAIHALLYAKELQENGFATVLVFDGAGTTWANTWGNPETESKYASLYKELQTTGVTEVVCDYCAGAFQVKDALRKQNAPLTAEYAGHPSIAKWIKLGYEVITL